MATNKNKQNLRYGKVCERLNKRKRYDGFSKDEITYIKTKEKYDRAEKELNTFWRDAPRKDNGSVNWESMNERELDYFEYINSQSEKLLKKLKRLEDKGIESDKVLNMFIQLNCNSVSF